jgi:hypothetical protein
MNKISPHHDSISQIAREIWEKSNRPSGRDLEIWLEAEKQSGVSSAGRPVESAQNVRGSGESQKSITSADPGSTEPAATPIEAEAKIARRKQSARAPRSAVKANPAKAETPVTGKPLWPKHKSR